MLSIGLLGMCALALLTCAAPASGIEWPRLQHVSGPTAQVATISLPLPAELDRRCGAAFASGVVSMNGHLVQVKPVSLRPEGAPPRRVLARIIGDLPEHLSASPSPVKAAADTGWSWDYQLLDNNIGKEVTYRAAMRNVPLEQTEYEMYQLNLRHGNRRVGVRLGLRWNSRLYWWQFIRADFIERGPVCDVLRCGGPIYNEETTVQGDLLLNLYANGVIEATAHFINNQREGEGRDTHGVPVIAFDVPGAPAIAQPLDGTRAHFDLGPARLNLGWSVNFADAKRPGSLRTEGDVIVWQPWLDQQISGNNLVEGEGIAEDHIIRSPGGSDRYWVANVGDHLIPLGVARSVPFILSLGDAPPAVGRYQAPSWWYAMCGELPTGGRLPVEWWAVKHAREIGPRYLQGNPQVGPFEWGAGVCNGDGSQGQAMLMLGQVTDDPNYHERALAIAYWWADIPVNHVNFTCHELYYSWQWVVQTYINWPDVVWAYWETGDPYLLETARFTADAYYRFFKTDRPHRSVGRDCLGVYGLLELYRCTAEQVYLDRARDILAEVRRSYDQTQYYWPGHQSGAGPNGVARHRDFEYIPTLQAMLHVLLLQAGPLPPQEEEESWRFVRFAMEAARDRGQDLDTGWFARRTAQCYVALTALADRFPQEEREWLLVLRRFNDHDGMPEAHDGHKAATWLTAAIWFDSWAWGARWMNGELHVRPRSLSDDARAPRTCVISTPAGPVALTREGGRVMIPTDAPCRVVVGESP